MLLFFLNVVIFKNAWDLLLHKNRGSNYVIMKTVRCIYILERKHLLILVNIWLLFIWYICTYAAVMQLCSEPRRHCFWSHVFALNKQTAFYYFSPHLAYTDDHKHFMSCKDALSCPHPRCFELTQSVEKWGSETRFENIPVVFHCFSLCG